MTDWTLRQGDKMTGTNTDTTKAIAEAAGAERVAGELRRQIAIERGEIAAAVEGFGTQEPPRPGVRDVDSSRRQSMVSMAPQLGVSVKRMLRRLLSPLRPPRQPNDLELLIGQRAELARLNQLRLAAETEPPLRRSVDVAIVYTHRQIQVIEARLAGRTE
jgi:hypothetical protein